MALYTDYFSILGLVVGLIASGWLLWRGYLRPKPKRCPPSCSRCWYNLKGLKSDVCPECGNPLNARTIKLEFRRKRPVLILAGLLLLALVIFLPFKAIRINWYVFTPTGQLVDDLESSTYAVCRPAMMELSRRFGIGSLSDSRRSDLIDFALSNQSKFIGQPRSPLTPDLVDLLGEAYLDGSMPHFSWTPFFALTSRFEGASHPVRKRASK